MLAQALHHAADVILHRGRRHAEFGGDLFICPALETVHIKNPAGQRWHAANGFAQRLHPLTAHGDALWGQLVILSPQDVADLVEYRGAVNLGAQVVGRQVGGDRKQIGAQILDRCALLGMRQFEICILRQVGRCVRALHPLVQKADECLLVVAVDLQQQRVVGGRGKVHDAFLQGTLTCCAEQPGRSPTRSQSKALGKKP